MPVVAYVCGGRVSAEGGWWVSLFLGEMMGGGDDQETENATRSLPSILNAPIVADVYKMHTFRDCVRLATASLVSTKSPVVFTQRALEFGWKSF